MTSSYKFYELIRVALGNAEKLSVSPTASQWQDIKRMAEAQSIDSILLDGFERLPKSQFPGFSLPCIAQWIGKAILVEKRNKLLNIRTGETLKYFRNNNFNCCILKGQGIAKAYPNPLRRIGGDIDIWLAASRRDIYTFSKNTLGKITGVNYHHIHFDLFDDVEVEVHIWPSFLSSPYRNYRLHQFARLYLPNNKVDEPSLAFNRVFILLHCYRHFCGHGVGMRQIMDYYWVLKQGFTEDERKESIKWIKRFGMMRFAKGVMWFLSEILGLDDEYLLCIPNERAGRFLLHEIMETGNMGHYDNRVNRKAYSTSARRFIQNLKRDVNIFCLCPHEAFWDPFFSIWNVLRLKINGFYI